MDMHRPSEVLDLLLARVFERKGELVAHLIAHDRADADPARLGQSFQPCRYIDTVTVDVASVFDDVAAIATHAAVGRRRFTPPSLAAPRRRNAPRRRRWRIRSRARRRWS